MGVAPNLVAEKRQIYLLGKKWGYFFFENKSVFSSVNMLGNKCGFKQAPWGTIFFPTHVH